ncbi:YeiH family protein [Colwellia sp. MEBiC06753]
MASGYLKLKVNLPGVATATLIGLAAMFLSEHYGAPAMLFALLLGIAFSFLHQETKCKAGIEFTAATILRIGVALLGFRIAFNDLIALGWSTALLLIAAIISTIILGTTLSKALGLSRRFGALTGGAVGICGASAAMAISSIMPENEHKERDTLLTIIGVTALSTLAMVCYPIIANYLGLTEYQTSIFLGGTIHDVAQVVGAGYSVSEQTGDLSTLVKLVRVSFLMPVVLIMLLVIKRKFQVHSPDAKPIGFPPFLVAFIVIMAINSLVNLPSEITDTATEISRFALIIAIAAIGMKSNLSKLACVGIKPIILMVIETTWLALFILIALQYL